MKPLPHSPAAICCAFVAALLAAMVFAALASPWIQALLAPLQEFPLHRVFSRLTMLGVIAMTAWLLIRYGLANRATLGFAGPWPRFARRLFVGLAVGAGLMKFALVALFPLQLRIWNVDAPVAWIDWVPLAVKGLGTGLAVALIEETFFRGAMQGALQRIGAVRWALFAVPALYAAVHFLGRAASVPAGQENALSGFVAFGGFFSGYARPFAIIDAFVALWCVGLLLALVRQRSGDIAGCIGLHAGFVAVITVFRKASSPVPGGEWSFLVSDFDGLLGWWVALLAGLACLAVWHLWQGNTK